MAKDNEITIKLDPNFKAEIDALFSDIGFTTEDAIHMFLEQSLLEGDFPFSLAFFETKERNEVSLDLAQLLLKGMKDPLKDIKF